MFNGIFGDLFDFNGDGRLDTIEQAAEFAFFNDVLKNDGEQDDECEEEENEPEDDRF